MSTIVIMPGGFHPFHAGHMALYNSARQAFPDADLYVAATNSQEERPFPFAVKEKLAKVAGVEPGHFIQVKSPFQAKEITQKYNPEQDVLIFVRSEKDRNESPKPGGTKKDGSPAYFQPYTGKNMQPFSKHAYFAYLPTVKFGPGITSATEIRKAWPTLDDRRKTAMVMSLYPAAQKNPKLAANVVKMLDMGMGNELDESWKNAIAGGAMALSALGAGAQTMPNVNAQQVELANKYYTVLVQRAKEDGIKLDTRTLNVIKAKAQDAAAKKTQQSTPQQGFPSQGSERRVAKDAGQFESQGVAEGSEEKDNLIWTLNSFGYYSDNSSVYVNDDGDKIVRVGSEWKHQSGERGRGPEELGTFLSSLSDVNEGSNDPWGPQGNFAGDTPVNLGGQTVNKLQVGDIVTYFGQKARIEAMSKTGNTSRITIANKMGGTTQDVLTRDLKRTGISEENGGVGGGFGTNYPGTYEQENGPFTHKGGLKLTSLTTESVDYLDEK